MMAVLLQKYPASGGPGIEPRWTRSDKDGVGTAYAALSWVWFPMSKGILNEVYYPLWIGLASRDFSLLALRAVFSYAVCQERARGCWREEVQTGGRVGWGAPAAVRISARRGSTARRWC